MNTRCGPSFYYYEGIECPLSNEGPPRLRGELYHDQCWRLLTIASGRTSKTVASSYLTFRRTRTLPAYQRRHDGDRMGPDWREMQARARSRSWYDSGLTTSLVGLVIDTALSASSRWLYTFAAFKGAHLGPLPYCRFSLYLFRPQCY